MPHPNTSDDGFLTKRERDRKKRTRRSFTTRSQVPKKRKRVTKKQLKKQYALKKRKLLLELQRKIIPSVQVITKHTWELICKEWGNKCAYCRTATPDTVDHVIPLSRGGLNSLDNVLPSCMSCNVNRKQNLTMYEWLGYEPIYKMHPEGFVYIVAFCVVNEAVLVTEEPI